MAVGGPAARMNSRGHQTGCKKDRELKFEPQYGLESKDLAVDIILYFSYHSHELEFLQSKSLEKLFAKHGVRVLRSNMTPMEEWKKNPSKFTGTDNSNSFATFR